MKNENVQLQVLREKLRLYEEPLLDHSLIQNLISSFAPKYKVFDLVKEGLLKVLKKGEFYFNLLSTKYITPQAVIGIYCKGSEYMIGGIYAYNQYGFSTQVPEWIEVYSDAYHGKKLFHNVKVIFRQARPSFFFDKLEKRSMGIRYYMMSAERALLELIKKTNGKMEFIDNLPKNVNPKKLKKLAYDHCSKRVQNLVSKLIIRG